MVANNRAHSFQDAATKRLLVAARAAGLYAAFPTWFAHFAVAQPPNLYAKQREQYETLLQRPGAKASGLPDHRPRIAAKEHVGAGVALSGNSASQRIRRTPAGIGAGTRLPEHAGEPAERPSSRTEG